MTILDALFDDDDDQRADALAALAAAPEHERSALGGKLAKLAKDVAALLAEADEAGLAISAHSIRLGRACVALARLRVEVAKSCLYRIADEGTPAVKSALAHSLRETTSAEGRSVLVYLLSDDDARGAAILAIGAAPWPEVLPALIEIAEADDHAARLAAVPIGKCGASAGPNERNAAADFLLEQLDDDAILPSSLAALLQFGRTFPGVETTAKRLATEPGSRKIAGLCLLAGCSDIGESNLAEMARSGAKTDPDAARKLLSPLLAARDEHVRAAAERTRKALDLR